MATSLSARRCLLDGLANANVGAATANVTGHRIVDVGIGWIGVGGKEFRSRHDLAGLAVAALNDLSIEPGLLDLCALRCRADRLDGSDLGLANTVDRRDAGTRGDAVDMHRTRAAERQAAAEFGAGHAKHVAQYPQQRSVVV